MRVGITSAQRGAELAEALERGGMSVTWAPPLRDDCEPARELLRQTMGGELDVLVFTSAGTVGDLLDIAAAAGVVRELVERARNGKVAVAATDPPTATALEEAGIPVVLMPRKPRTGALLRTLDAWWACRDEVLPPRVELLPSAHAARVAGRVCVFGELGFGLLAALVRRPGMACPLDLLMRETWGSDAPPDPTPVKHHVARIRRKLGPAAAAIETVRGVGYRFRPAALDDRR